MEEHGLIKPMQCRQELAHIIRPARTHLQQVNAGRKYSALPGHYDRTRVGGTKLIEVLRQFLAQRDIQRIGFAMPDGKNRNAVLGFQLNHVSDRRTTAPPAKPQTTITHKTRMVKRGRF